MVSISCEFLQNISEKILVTRPLVKSAEVFRLRIRLALALSQCIEKGQPKNHRFSVWHVAYSYFVYLSQDESRWFETSTLMQVQSMAAPCSSHQGGATNLHCKQISTNFMYYIQNVTVLDVAVLENTNSLSNNLMITCVCIVHGVVSSCVPFTSSFKVGK